MKHSLIKSMVIYLTVIPLCVLIYYFDLFRFFSGNVLSWIAAICLITVFAVAFKVVGISGKKKTPEIDDENSEDDVFEESDSGEDFDIGDDKTDKS